MSNFRFDHERLVVYQKARTFCSLAVKVRSRLPRGWGSTGDQLHRAAFSILLNIAEGAGRRSPAEKANFYQIAFGSTAECAAVLDALTVALPLAILGTDEARLLLVELQAMLNALLRRFRQP